jgi:hypothetical protein
VVLKAGTAADASVGGAGGHRPFFAVPSALGGEPKIHHDLRPEIDARKRTATFVVIGVGRGVKYPDPTITTPLALERLTYRGYKEPHSPKLNLALTRSSEVRPLRFLGYLAKGVIRRLANSSC